ncbi:MAG: DUF368 domain-containing protein [Wujia sp.]
MNFLTELIKGVFVGVANVIPGVSGGTMAVSFGIYDKLLSSISNLLKDFKNSIKTLFPIIIGMAIGIVGFTFIIPWMLENQPFITSIAFSGLIFGGLPMIVKSLSNACKTDKNKSYILNVALFVIFMVVAIAMLFMNGDSESGVLLSVDLKTVIVMFFIGIIASATMIIPGVSGSLVLMILGYYFGIISAVKDFVSGLKDLDINVMLDRGFILAPFAIGCLLGIFFISKLIAWLFEHYSSATYSAILGLIIASPVSIFYKVDQEYGLSGTSAVQVIIGIVICVLCLALTNYMGKLDTDKE